MATTYKNVCGNCVGRIELIFLRQFINAQFLKLSSQRAMIKKNQMHTYEMSKKCQLYPTQFESPISFYILRKNVPSSNFLKLISKMHSCCFSIMGSHENFEFHLVVKLSVDLGYTFLSLRL
jgi:hypothetical protein